MNTPEEALQRMMRGNESICENGHNAGRFCRRANKANDKKDGPLAVVIACADMRVDIGRLFGMGDAELFVLRTAGNIAGPAERESALYACDYLGAKLVVVLGHTHCDAVDAALGVTYDASGREERMRPHLFETLFEHIHKNTGRSTAPDAASAHNARAGVKFLETAPRFAELIDTGQVELRAALCDVETGVVAFLNN